MNLLLDTCTFIWLASSPNEPSDAAAERIQDTTNELFLSLASGWEICLKSKTRKIQLPDKPLPWILGRLSYWHIKTLELDLQSIAGSAELPDFHKDPFDRMLVAQALTHGLTILTPDPFVRKYSAQTLW